jgi:hypothetical protein
MTTGQATSAKIGLPVWARILICLVVSVMVFAIGGSFVGLMSIQRLSREAKNPAAVLKNAQKIAQFPQPLPEGYGFVTGVKLFYVVIVVIEHKSDHQQIVFYCLPPSKEIDAKNLLDQAYDLGLNPYSVNGKFQELKSSGTAEIAFVPMPFRIGTYQDTNGKPAEGMVGCICVNNPAKNILIYSYPAPGNAYNHDVTMNLLKSIKGF